MSDMVPLDLWAGAYGNQKVWRVYAPKKVVIFDIDNTLSDARWRANLIPNWDEFHAGLIDDEPFIETMNLCRMLYESNLGIYLITGRPEKHRNNTRLWLEKHNLKYHAAMFRCDGDLRPSSMVKREHTQRIIKAGNEIVLAFDDEERNILEFHKLGIQSFFPHTPDLVTADEDSKDKTIQN